MARVLVSGCSSGIGRAAVRELGERGFEVVATARDVNTITDLTAAMHLKLDVTDDRSVAEAVSAALPLDALVNNAGITVWGPVECVASDDYHAVFETNVFGAVRMMQAVLPHFRAQRRGWIVNVSSVAGQRTGPLVGFYAASKSALESLTETVRLEVGHLGVRVAIVEPGAVDSNFAANRRIAAVDAPEYLDLVERSTASLQANRARATSAEEVAAEIASLLASDHPPLRRPVGAAAAALIEERRSRPDDEWEALVRDRIGLR